MLMSILSSVTFILVYGMSVELPFACYFQILVYATQRTANCIALAILIGTYQLANDVRVRRCNACVRICSLHNIALGQSSNSGSECHTVLVGSRVQVQETVLAGSGSCGVSLSLKPVLNTVW